MEHQDGHSHHITPISAYAKTLAALGVLMFLTVAVAVGHWVPNSYANNLIAMGIATAKATLVILFFMGVKYNTRLTQFYAALGFLWFAFFFIMFCDYATRRNEPVRGWETVPLDAMPRGPFEQNAMEATDPEAMRLREIYGR